MEWISDNLSVGIPIIIFLLAGLGFLIKRQLRGDGHVEEQASIEQTIRLKKLLESEGLTLKEARQLRDEFRRGRGSLTKAEAEAIVEKTEEAKKHAFLDPQEGDSTHVAFEDTNIGMQAQAKSELKVLESQLEFAVTEFAHECTEARQRSLYEAQEAWQNFRAAESKFASLAWEGGSGAPLLGVSRMAELTEQRIKDIRLAQAEANL